MVSGADSRSRKPDLASRSGPSGFDRGDWRPIETAPRDGRFILLHCPGGQLESGDVTVGAYSAPLEPRDERGRFRPGDWEGWLGMDVDIRSSWCGPTHWMPLPLAPIETRSDETRSGSARRVKAG